MYEMTIELSETDVKKAMIEYVDKYICELKPQYDLISTTTGGNTFKDVTLVFKELPVQPSTEQV